MSFRLVWNFTSGWFSEWILFRNSNECWRTDGSCTNDFSKVLRRTKAAADWVCHWHVVVLLLIKEFVCALCMMQVTTTLDLMEDKSFLDKDLPKFSFDLLHSKSKVLLLGSLDSKKYRFLENMYKWVQTKKIGDCLMFPKCLFFEDITYPFDERSCALVFEKSQKENQNLALFLDLCDPWM